MSNQLDKILEDEEFEIQELLREIAGSVEILLADVVKNADAEESSIRDSEYTEKEMA